LILTGLTSPTTTENTSVHMFFEGLVSTPVDAGSGVYFIPEPAGYFDVAAYLVRQGAANVPNDLSILIAANGTVPEPASLVMAGIGVVAGLCVVIRRHRHG
jgi:PEP-CTERM motif